MSSILEELQAKAQEAASAQAENGGEQNVPQNSKPEAGANADAENSAAQEAPAKGDDKEKNTDGTSVPEPEKVEADKPGKGVFANEELAEANAYLEKNPDKTFDDYRALKKPTDQVGEDELLSQYLSEKEGKTPSEIAYELKRLEARKSEEEDDFGDSDDDDLETLKLKAERERMLRDAREWRSGYVDAQLGKSTERQEAQNQEPETLEQFTARVQEIQQKQREDYTTKIYSALPEIQDIALSVGGEEFHYTPDEEFRSEMKATSEDISTVTKKFFDESGNITDAKGFIQDAAVWVNPVTRKKLIDEMISQAIAKDRANGDRRQRNINLDAVVPSTSTSAANSADAFEQFRKSRQN